MRSFPFLNSDFLKNLQVVEWGYTEEARPLTYDKYLAWTSKEGHGPLSYLNDHRKDIREDVRKFHPEFQSALVFLFSYRPVKKWLIENNKNEVAAYTLGFGGEDYHYALKRNLQAIGEELKVSFPEIEFFLSLDIQPVLERDLAYRAGLGWFGKNSMLINRKEGSYFIIGSLLLNHKLPLPMPAIDVDHCGQCTACADACPTNAIDVESRTLHSSQCISTFTIELFKEAPAPFGYENSRGEIFGCDICQDVCPWNRKPLLRENGALTLTPPFIHLKEWLLEWPKEKLQEFLQQESKRGVRKLFHNTAFERPGREGWLKNLKAHLTSSQSDPSKKQRGEQ